MKNRTATTLSLVTAILLLNACGSVDNSSLVDKNSSSSTRVQRDNKIEQCFVKMDDIAFEDCSSKYSDDSKINSCLDGYEEQILDTCMLYDGEEDYNQNDLVGDNTDMVSDNDWWNWLEEESAFDDKNETIAESNDTTSISTATIEDAKAEPYFKYAWHLNSSNSILNSKGYQIDNHADINVTDAWAITMGEGVRVAVIDDGADVTHEDLKENLLITYNADTGSKNIQTKDSHGNTCAGFIVAPINGKGIVGVSPKAKMISIKLEDSSDAYTIRAFEYAKKHGAKVISCSWGTNDVSDAIVSELKSIYDSGITVLFASGNEGASLDNQGVNDESEVEWVIGVGASGENNDITSYSNYGKNIDILAPGGDAQDYIGVLGLDNMGEDGYDDQTGLVNNNYAFTNGTSFSAPITAGVVAMMYSVNPNITPKEVKEILTSTATKIGKEMSASYNENGFDEKRAYGKINAGLAVAKAKETKRP